MKESRVDKSDRESTGQKSLPNVSNLRVCSKDSEINKILNYRRIFLGGGCRYPSIGNRLKGNQSYNSLYNCSC